MIDRNELAELAQAARATLSEPARSTLVGGDEHPRFELFQAGMSLCSQKIRTVLHEKGIAYRSNDMNILCAMGDDGIVPAEQYHPDYIQLRLIAGRELSQQFVTGYGGGTSVEAEGFDPCVVPLLVDYEAGRVIADSLRICSYLDAESSSSVKLLPDAVDARDEAMRQVRIVDQIPNVALLYGFHPDDDRRPDMLKQVMETVYDYKVMALEALIAANPDAPELIAAYQAKILKESGGKAVCHDAKFQRAARDKAAVILAGLERDLSGRPGPYLNGDLFSLGDVLWGCNLIRLTYLGLASMWHDLPHVVRYAAVLPKRPSLCREAVHASVKALPPSAYMEELTRC